MLRLIATIRKCPDFLPDMSGILHFCSSLKIHPYMCNHDKIGGYGQYDENGHICNYGILKVGIEYGPFKIHPRVDTQIFQGNAVFL